MANLAGGLQIKSTGMPILIYVFVNDHGIPLNIVQHLF